MTRNVMGMTEKLKTHWLSMMFFSFMVFLTV